MDLNERLLLRDAEMTIELGRLRAEIERLLAALASIIKQDQIYIDGIRGATEDGYSAEIARAALAGTEGT